MLQPTDHAEDHFLPFFGAGASFASISLAFLFVACLPPRAPAPFVGSSASARDSFAFGAWGLRLDLLLGVGVGVGLLPSVIACHSGTALDTISCRVQSCLPCLGSICARRGLGLGLGQRLDLLGLSGLLTLICGRICCGFWLRQSRELRRESARLQAQQDKERAAAEKAKAKEEQTRLRSIADQMKSSGNDKLPGLLAFCGSWIKAVREFKTVADFKAAAASLDVNQPFIITDASTLKEEESASSARVNFTLFKACPMWEGFHKVQAVKVNGVLLFVCRCLGACNVALPTAHAAAACPGWTDSNLLAARPFTLRVDSYCLLSLLIGLYCTL